MKVVTIYKDVLVKGDLFSEDRMEISGYKGTIRTHSLAVGFFLWLLGKTTFQKINGKWHALNSNSLENYCIANGTKNDASQLLVLLNLKDLFDKVERVHEATFSSPVEVKRTTIHPYEGKRQIVSLVNISEQLPAQGIPPLSLPVIK